MVCASVEHLEDGGTRVIRRQATKADQQDMAECLKLLGFERDDNPTGKDRTRKWRFINTEDTESARGSVSAETVDSPGGERDSTQTHSVLGESVIRCD